MIRIFVSEQQKTNKKNYNNHQSDKSNTVYNCLLFTGQQQKSIVNHFTVVFFFITMLRGRKGQNDKEYDLNMKCLFVNKWNNLFSSCYQNMQYIKLLLEPFQNHFTERDHPDGLGSAPAPSPHTHLSTT